MSTLKVLQYHLFSSYYEKDTMLSILYFLWGRWYYLSITENWNLKNLGHVLKVKWL